MSDFENFKELLPSKEKFYSLLTGKKISGKEYERVLKVWNKFEMKTMKDVFEKFRNNSLKNYGLYPNHYFSTPALCWNAMLNMTKIKLVLISDPEMYIFFEKGMRGGVLIFLMDIVKLARSIWNVMTQNKNQNILYT